MMKRVALTGNDAAAEAFKQVNPDVASVFPITPQTELMHKFSQFVSDGYVDTELINVESEHSAMSSAIGAAAAGARTISATSANGLALMWEMLYIAASTRLPIVMPVVNRALSGPINIHNDHSDSMGARDSGWIQLHSENSQEAYDNVIQAFRIGEHKDIMLPVMPCFDGFIISHTMETLEVFEDKKPVQDFVGSYEPEHYLLDSDNPMTVGPLDLQDYYFEHKRQQVEAMRKAKQVIVDVHDEYGKLSGRTVGNGIYEAYKVDDAELVIVALGSTAGTTKVAIDAMREAGKKVGLVKIRMFRPFPGDEIAEVLSGAKKIAVLDKSCSFGLEGGPLFNEIRSFTGKDIPMKSYVYGLGGRDINVQHLMDITDDLEKWDGDEIVTYFGVRE